MTDFSTSGEFELTRDMADTIAEHFDGFAENGILRIVQDQTGLWLVSSERRAFLGLARLPRTSARRLI